MRKKESTITIELKLSAHIKPSISKWTRSREQHNDMIRGAFTQTIHLYTFNVTKHCEARKRLFLNIGYCLYPVEQLNSHRAYTSIKQQFASRRRRQNTIMPKRLRLDNKTQCTEKKREEKNCGKRQRRWIV